MRTPRLLSLSLYRGNQELGLLLPYESPEVASTRSPGNFIFKLQIYKYMHISPYRCAEPMNSSLSDIQCIIKQTRIDMQTHTCQPSVIRKESPSFWHRRKPPSRRRKSPSFDGHLDINKLRLFLVIKSENSREYSRHVVILFLCWTHSDLLLQTTLDHPNFTFAHSRPSFKTVTTRTRKLDVSQTDVSPKKIQIQK